MVSIIASIGFVLAVTSFIAGFRMVKSRGGRAEPMMHRVNGYLTMGAYVVVAALAIISGTEAVYLIAWAAGLAVHYFKLLLVRKRLAARYGGYLGAMMLITWFVVIYTHLPG